MNNPDELKKKKWLIKYIYWKQMYVYCIGTLILYIWNSKSVGTRAAKRLRLVCSECDPALFT